MQLTFYKLAAQPNSRLLQITAQTYSAVINVAVKPDLHHEMWHPLRGVVYKGAAYVALADINNNAATANTCERCTSQAFVPVETRGGVEQLCLGCATAVIRDRIGVLAGAKGPVCDAIRADWNSNV